MSREAHAIAAFSWGFDIGDDLEIEVVGPSSLDVETWDEHIGRLRTSHPGWTFGRAM